MEVSAVHLVPMAETLHWVADLLPLAVVVALSVPMVQRAAAVVVVVARLVVLVAVLALVRPDKVMPGAPLQAPHWLAAAAALAARALGALVV